MCSLGKEPPYYITKVALTGRTVIFCDMLNQKIHVGDQRSAPCLSGGDQSPCQRHGYRSDVPFIQLILPAYGLGFNSLLQYVGTQGVSTDIVVPGLLLVWKVPTQKLVHGVHGLHYRRWVLQPRCWAFRAMFRRKCHPEAYCVNRGWMYTTTRFFCRRRHVL